MSDPQNPELKPMQANFKLEDLPREVPALPDHVRQQIQAIKAQDSYLGPAMESVEPQKDNRINTTVFEAGDPAGLNLKVSAIGKVAGLNLKGRF